MQNFYELNSFVAFLEHIGMLMPVCPFLREKRQTSLLTTLNFERERHSVHKKVLPLLLNTEKM